MVCGVVLGVWTRCSLVLPCGLNVPHTSSVLSPLNTSFLLMQINNANHNILSMNYNALSIVVVYLEVYVMIDRQADRQGPHHRPLALLVNDSATYILIMNLVISIRQCRKWSWPVFYFCQLIIKGCLLSSNPTIKIEKSVQFTVRSHCLNEWKSDK